MLVWRCIVVACGIALSSVEAIAAPCVNPNALGVSRTIAVDPRTLPAVGRHNYDVTLPLSPGEVVLTFDDGPIPRYTKAVLKTLAHECLRATFFMVGRQANAHPGMARRVRDAGHTVATHTQNHPLFRMSPQSAAREIESGIASVSNALGPRRQVAPFFRFPGLYRTGAAETYLRRRSLMVWSVDVDSYDWKRNTTEQMLAGTMARLEARRGGILLMHDIKPKTARALPRLIALLKARGFRVVHVVPASGALPAPPLMSSTPATRDFDVTFTSAVPR